MLQSMTVREAIRETLKQEFEKNPDSMMMGENFGFGGSIFSKVVARELHEQFGDLRVMEAPVSENAIIGLSFGAALAGMTVVPEIYSADFLFCVGTEVVNDIPKWRYQHQYKEPLNVVIRAPMGLHKTGGGGPEHSQCPEAFFHNAPGLIIVAPATPTDAVGLMKTSLSAGDPVLYLEHRSIYDDSEEIDVATIEPIPLGKARVCKEGTDVTIVAWAMMEKIALEAADKLESMGISAEVIDPRTIKPMDFDAIIESVKKTSHLIVAEETPITGSIAGEIFTRVAEADVQCSFKRLTMPDILYHYNPTIERSFIPSADDIVRAAKEMLA